MVKGNPEAKARDLNWVDKPHLKGKEVPYVELPPLRAKLCTSDNAVKIDQSSKSVPAFKSKGPMEIGLDIEKLVETVLDLEISIPLRSLAGISTVVQKEIKKQVTKSKIPVEETKNTVQFSCKGKPLIRIESLPVASYLVNTDVSDELPEGHLVATDPVLQYLVKNKDVVSEDLIVAS